MALGLRYAGNIASDSGVSFEELTAALGRQPTRVSAIDANFGLHPYLLTYKTKVTMPL